MTQAVVEENVLERKLKPLALNYFNFVGVRKIGVCQDRPDTIDKREGISPKTISQPKTKVGITHCPNTYVTQYEKSGRIRRACHAIFTSPSGNREQSNKMMGKDRAEY